MTEDEVTRDEGEQRKEFIEEQASGIGATDWAKILGLSKWGTPLTVYDRLVNGPRDRQMSLPAWLGLKMQRTVAELYNEATSNRTRADNQHHRHPVHHWLVCHLDFRVVSQPKLLVECKTRAYMKGWGEDGSTEIPADIWVQCQAEMAVTGAYMTHVAVLFGHHTYRTYPIPRDEQFIDKAVARLERFWFDNVVAKVPPDPIGSDLDRQYLAEQHPDHDDVLIAATAEQEMLVNRLRVARDTTAVAEKAELEVANLIRDIIGDNAGLTGSFGTITWKKSRDSEQVGWDQVAITYASVIEELLACVNADSFERARVDLASQAYETAVSLATIVKPGSRRFLVQFAKEK